MSLIVSYDVGVDFFGNKKADHRDRATVLATLYGGMLLDSPTLRRNPHSVDGLETIIFWDHGSSDRFCGMTPPEMAETVKAWKKKNPTLDAIEIITCNARHVGTLKHSFTDALLISLSKKIARTVKIKALPVLYLKDGTRCTNSILLWDKDRNSWAYFGTGDYKGPTKRYKGPPATESTREHWILAGRDILDDFCQPAKARQGLTESYVEVTALRRFDSHHSLAPKVKKMGWDNEHYFARLQEWRKNATVMTGNISTLRWLLADIR